LKKPLQGITSPDIKDSYSVLHQNAQLQFDTVPIAIILVDLNGRIQFMNRSAEDLLGNPSQNLKLEDWPQEFGLYLEDGTSLYPGENLLLARALQGETIEEAEEIILRKAGDEPDTWISISTSLRRNENGHIEGAIVLLRDVTHRKKIEFSREKHIQRTEALYKLSHIISEAGNDLNEIIQLAARFPAEVIGGMSIVSMLTSSKSKLKIAAFYDSNPTGQALLEKVLNLEAEHDLSGGLAGKVVESGEPLLISPIPAEQLEESTWPAFEELAGEIDVHSVLIVPIIGRSGALGVINLFRYADSKPFSSGDKPFLSDILYRLALAMENCRLFDSLREEIGQRLATKKDLEISQARFRSIFESVTLGVKVLDLEGNILQINQAFREMLGYTEDEFTGKHFHSFLHPDDILQAAKLFRDVKNDGVSSFRFEHRTLHKDQSVVWAKTFFTVVKKDENDDVPTFIVGIVENITEQKRHELEMAELKDRLQNSMELERLRLAQELHDNPMQALYSASYRIEELRSKADLPTREALQHIKETIHDVLKDLRATAKELRPPNISSFGLENAIRSYAHDFQEKHPNIKTHIALAHDQLSLPDKVRLALFRVLQQSLANVIRHAEATEVHIRFQFDAEEAKLEIRDNGKGFEVPVNWIDLVRQEHYGLAGAAERISAIGGTLTVESQPGHLTVVCASIPMDDYENDDNQ